MVGIDLPTPPMVCMQIPNQHVQGYNVYRRFVRGAFEHLDNNLICIVFSDSIIAVVIIVEYQYML